MRVRMVLQVPLTMPRSASMRLARRPRSRASMMGIPPPQLASKAMQVLLARASAKSSGPRRARRDLLAVTMGLESLRARSMKVPAMPVPPINSMMISDRGSSMAALALVDMGSSAALGGYSD